MPHDEKMTKAQLLHENRELRRRISALERTASQHQHAEEVLRASEARFRAIHEYAPFLMDAFDQHGRCILWNRECEKTFGWTLAELNAHDDPLSLFYPDPQVRAEVMESVTSVPGGTFREWHPLTKDGTERATLWANFRLPDGTVINLGQDVTERKQAEEALTAHREHLEQLVDERTTELREVNANLEREITEHRQAQEALRRERQYSERLIASSVDGIIAFDRNCLYTIWNAGMERISGVQANQVLGKSAFEIFPFLKKTGEDRFLYDALAGKTVVATDRPHVIPETNREGFHEGYYSPLRDESGEVVGGFGVIRDTTERKLAEEAIRQKEYIIESASNAIATADLDGRMTYVNPAFLKTWGFDDAGEVLGRPFPAFWMVEDRLDRIMDALRHEGKWSDEMEARRKDGNLFHVQVSAATVLDNEGRPIALMCSSEDISERKRVQEALRKSEARLRAILDYSPALISTKDLDGKITLVNRQFNVLAGVSPEQLIGTTVYDFHPPDVADELRKNDLAAREGVVESEITVLHKDRSKHTYLVVRFPLIDTDRNLLGTCSISTDITERKRGEEERLRLERQFQHAQKLESLGVLAGGIAHDFNNLLYVILGSTDLALQDLSEVSPARPHIEEIERATLHAADLTRQMLAYSGRGRFEVRVLNLSELVAEMAHLIKALTPKNVDVRMHLQQEMPGARADAVQIQQVVINLITNAAEAIASDEPGTVDVSTGTTNCSQSYLSRSRVPERPDEGEFAYIEVMDSGCGMNEEAKEKLFDPFFTTKFTGRGLGLSAVLGIVRGHQGAIVVDSEPRWGTTVRILFPALAEPAQSSLRRGVDREAESWSGEGTFLVVDDEEAVRNLAKRMLERLGFDVLIARDGREAVEVYRGHSSEIVGVLLDLSMPHMDGEQTFRELRREKADARVILSSGYAEQELEERLGDLGISAFIQKPYRLATLKEKLRIVLEA